MNENKNEMLNWLMITLISLEKRKDIDFIKEDIRIVENIYQSIKILVDD